MHDEEVVVRFGRSGKDGERKRGSVKPTKGDHDLAFNSKTPFQIVHRQTSAVVAY
jgi:hypothetical protein